VGLQAAPAAFDLRIEEAEAAPLSGALAVLLTAGRPWRQCREQVLAAYPVSRRQRRERFAEVMAGQRDYSSAELDAELPDLRRTLVQLSGARDNEFTPDQFLALLRRQVGVDNGTDAIPSDDLSQAIRRRMQGRGPLPGGSAP